MTVCPDMDVGRLVVELWVCGVLAKTLTSWCLKDMGPGQSENMQIFKDKIVKYVRTMVA